MGITGQVAAVAMIAMTLVPAANACEGTVELAGGSVGCRSYEGTIKTIEFDTDDSECKFEKKPSVSVSTSTGSRQDSLDVQVLSRNRKGFTVKITSAGSHRNEICAPTSFSWSARR